MTAPSPFEDSEHPPDEPNESTGPIESIPGAAALESHVFSSRPQQDPKDKAYKPDENAWVPEKALEALKMERTVTPESDESDEDFARRMFRESAPHAAAAIVHTAIHGANERNRLSAGQYVIDRVMGRPGEDAYGGKDNPIVKFIQELEDKANEGITSDIPEE